MGATRSAVNQAVSRRGILAGVVGLGGAAAAACGGGPGRTEAQMTRPDACTGTLEFISPWNVGSSAGDGLVLLGEDFKAAHPGCTAQLLFVPGGNTAILEKLVSTIAGGAQPPIAL